MLILSLQYKKDLGYVEQQLEAHIAWLKQGYERGWFIASGRKNPRTGGVIFAKGDREEIERFCRQDPFSIHGIADYDITEVLVTMTAAGLEALKQD